MSSTTTDSAARPSADSFYDLAVHEGNDPMLLKLDSGIRVTESSLMSPPPPSPQPPASAPGQPFLQIITINAIPIDKTIRVVQPDGVIWYRSQFLYRQRGDLNETFFDFGSRQRLNGASRPQRSEEGR